MEEQDTDIVLYNHMIYSCGERLSLHDDKGFKFVLLEKPCNLKEEELPVSDRKSELEKKVGFLI